MSTVVYNLPVEYGKLDKTSRRAVREQYIKQQNGNCHHCGGPLSEPAPEKVMRLRINKKLFPKGFFDWPVHLHHSHDSGLTIGAVHCHCNAVLWQFYGE